MGMFGHWWELGIIVALVLIIFGPGRLGDIGSALGKTVREFKRSVHGEEEEA
jgi:sec-independent protein translocase protein TatA